MAQIFETEKQEDYLKNEMFYFAWKHYMQFNLLNIIKFQILKNLLNYGKIFKYSNRSSLFRKWL